MAAGNCITKKSMHQASLLCNLESFGLLNTENGEITDDKNRSANTEQSNSVVVELGPGRGYITHALCLL